MIESDHLKIEELPGGQVVSFVLPSSASDLSIGTNAGDQGQDFFYNHQVGSFFWNFTVVLFAYETILNIKNQVHQIS